MSQSASRTALAALLLAAACAEQPSPTEPPFEAAGPAPPVAQAQGGSPDRVVHERLARRLVIALRDAEFRAAVQRALQASLEREGKVHLQRFLSAEGGRHGQRLAALAAEAEATISGELAAVAPIELYLPVPEHRRSWRGGPNVWVATAEADEEAPVAFDTRGRRQLLDVGQPPSQPVIALGRAETAFAGTELANLACETCFDEPPDDGTGGTGGGTLLPLPGLYMTYAKFSSTFEGWLKGAPEFDVHILGQDGSSTTMRSYQCAGESAVGSYQFNQDDKTWNGRVLLFSQAQLDAYSVSHPGQAVRVLVLEDDDSPCVIKTDSARIAKTLKQLSDGYGAFTGGKDKQTLSIRTFKNAATLLNLLRSVWSFLHTQDDVVGFAIEDIVAGEFSPGANWIVKGENSVTAGAIRLELR